MPDRKKNNNDRVVVGPTFSLNFQNIFSSSISNKLKERLRDHFVLVNKNNSGRATGISRRLRKDFLKDFFSVDNESELLKKNEIIANKHKEVSEEIIEQAGLGRKEFPAWIIKKLEGYIKQNE